MCHADEQWIEAPPLVLLGIRNTFKEDLQSSTGELVYGEPLRVSGDLLASGSPKVEASAFIQQLRRQMDLLHPTPTARLSSLSTFVHKEHEDSIHVFLRQDTVRHGLQPH